jgi:hypothetical protein
VNFLGLGRVHHPLKHRPLPHWSHRHFHMRSYLNILYSVTPRPEVDLVTHGFTQVPGEDNNDTYAPIVRASSIRTLFALAAQGLLIIHLDIETAFLNGDLEENTLVQIPPGFVFPPEFVLPNGLTTDNSVLQLNKALYGLKQASNVWSTTFKREMLRLGFTIAVRQLLSDKNKAICILSSKPYSLKKISSFGINVK